TTEIYTLSLHDALPIWEIVTQERDNIKSSESDNRLIAHTDEYLYFDFVTSADTGTYSCALAGDVRIKRDVTLLVTPPTITLLPRSEEHTSELQSRSELV